MTSLGSHWNRRLQIKLDYNDIRIEIRPHDSTKY